MRFEGLEAIELEILKMSVSGAREDENFISIPSLLPSLLFELDSVNNMKSSQIWSIAGITSLTAVLGYAM